MTKIDALKKFTKISKKAFMLLNYLDNHLDHKNLTHTQSMLYLLNNLNYGQFGTFLIDDKFVVTAFGPRLKELDGIFTAKYGNQMDIIIGKLSLFDHLRNREALNDLSEEFTEEEIKRIDFFIWGFGGRGELEFRNGFILKDEAYKDALDDLLNKNITREVKKSLIKKQYQKNEDYHIFDK